jgi:hypothetical protein
MTEKKDTKPVTIIKSAGLGFFTIAGIVLTILKLCNLINLSWLWVIGVFCIPLFTTISILLLFGIIGGALAVGTTIICYIMERLDRKT